VASWARVEKDGQLKSFGFCKFATAEGALRALRVLDGIKLADENLQLKVDQKTTEELADYERKKREFILREEEEQKKTGTIIPIPYADTEDQDKKAQEAIERITASVLKALNDDTEGVGVVSREIRGYREKQAKIDREKKRKRGGK